MGVCFSCVLAAYVSSTLMIPLFSGILASIMINRWDCRVVSFIGGLLMSAGILLAAFAHNLYLLVFSFGFVAGRLQNGLRISRFRMQHLLVAP